MSRHTTARRDVLVLSELVRILCGSFAGGLASRHGRRLERCPAGANQFYGIFDPAQHGHYGMAAGPADPGDGALVRRAQLACLHGLRAPLQAAKFA